MPVALDVGAVPFVQGFGSVLTQKSWDTAFGVAGLLRAAGTSGVVATAVQYNAAVVTSDPGDLTHLADSLGMKINLFTV